MSALRILHIDDEPDIRELVDISLGLDSEFAVKSCASGADALTVAADWSPDLILMDVMMPVMDGPQTLGRLREIAGTADIPVVFMTARAQARELAHFLSLGAAGVIPKPFDPMTLAGAVKQYLHTSVPNNEDTAARFFARARRDAKALAECRSKIQTDPSGAYPRIEKLAQTLIGPGAAYDLDAVGSAALVVLRMVEDAQNGIGGPADVEDSIDRLVEAVDRDCGEGADAVPTARSA
jgi:CheY-like chemotaxis protein